CKTQIVIGFIVSSRLICLELICTPKVGGGEYNLKDSGLIHTLEPVLFLLFLFEFQSCVRDFPYRSFELTILMLYFMMTTITHE
ncbi:hypothetical protein Gotur_029010, partial [Gossypium turneri]